MKAPRSSFASDLLAGISVSFAALALGAAFGVMSGRGAFAGMIAAGVIPIITGLFGGTRLSVSGPTGPMTAVSSVVIALAYDKFVGDRLLAEQFITLVFMLTSVGLLLAGILRTGRLIQFVPKTVILGFMSGIAMVIWVQKVPSSHPSDSPVICRLAMVGAGGSSKLPFIAIVMGHHINRITTITVVICMMRRAWPLDS